MPDDVLLSFDDMMTKCVLMIDDISSLSMVIWTDVLTELDKRGKVRLISGSYDHIGDAMIQRI